jgi:putative transposase
MTSFTLTLFCAKTSFTHLGLVHYDSLSAEISPGRLSMEEETRRKAIERYLDGESPKSIYEDLKRTKQWFFKWLRRYQSGDPHWYQSKSRTPLHRPFQIDETQRQQIISVREHLDSERFAQIGVSAIKWELKKQGIEFPSDRTISRVLSSEGLVKKNCLYA